METKTNTAAEPAKQKLTANKITPFLWFDTEAEEAMNYYTSIFKNSKRGTVIRSPADSPSGKEGSVLTATFELEGVKFTVLNGGPHFKFTEAISFVVSCDTQEEVDYYWEKLTADGGAESQCGWLRDKFGLSWQITPKVLIDWLSDKDAQKAKRVMQAMMKMVKIEIPELKRAYEGRS